MHNLSSRSFIRHILKILIVIAILLQSQFFVSVAPALAANPPPIQIFFLSMPEDQVLASFKKITASPAAPMISVTGISVTTSDTQIYYDQWENGYELDLANPTNIYPAVGGTQIWGNGLAADGCPPNIDGRTPLVCTNENDILSLGNTIVLNNEVPLPRTSAVFYDGRDKLGSNKVIAVTRSLWAKTPGTVLADAVEVYDTTRWGTYYEMPVGENTTNNPSAGTNTLFSYSSALIIASQNGTSVTIDPDGTGATAAIGPILLNQGDAYQVNGGMKMGGTVTSNNPIQVNLLTGKVGSTYASRWFSLPPSSGWTNSLWTSVGTTVANYPSTVFVFNPSDSTALTVNYETKLGTGSFSVPVNGTYRFEMPLLSGAHFYTSGAPFQAVGGMDTSLTGADQTYDWGYTLVPDTWLTTAFVAGWAPGTADYTGNGSPVWVTAIKPTTIYVDYGAPSPVGGFTDPNGKSYNVSYPLGKYESLQIKGVGNTQTGMKVWTVDGTSITGAWGEDPKTASAGTPFLDVGYTIPPLPMVTLTKAAALASGGGDINGNGKVDAGDTIQYSLTVENKGAVMAFNTVVTDSVPLNTTYVAGSTKLNSAAVPDNPSAPLFPLTGSGVTIPTLAVGASIVLTYQMKTDTIPPASYTEIVNTAKAELNGDTFTVTLHTPLVPVTVTSCALTLRDITYASTVTSYQQNGIIYVQVTDGDKNTLAGTAETITVQVVDATTADRQALILTETGVNTGIFQGSLPSSTTLGQLPDDGTLYALAGDSLTATYADPIFGDSCNASASIVVTTTSLIKQLYLNDPMGLNRVNPAAVPVDNTTAMSATLSNVAGGGGGGTAVTSDNFAANYGSFSEVGDDTVLATGNVRYNTAGSCPSTNCVRIGDGSGTNPNLTNVGLVHALMDLTGATSANVSFAFTIPSAITNPIKLQASTDGTTWHDITTIPTSGTNQTLAINDISAYISATTYIRFVGSGPVGTNLWAYIDTVNVTKNGASVTVTSVSFTQSPTMAAPLVVPTGNAVGVVTYVSTTGTMVANPNLTATLRNGATTFATLTNPTYNAGTGTLTWSGTTSTSTTIPATTGAVILTITDAQAAATYAIQYDSSTKPSVITLPTTTVIKVDSLDFYDAPYPGGALISNPANGQTVYIRASVSDPFGDADITSAVLDITDPANGHTAPALVAVSPSVPNSGAIKIYEAPWSIPATPGDYIIKVTANEGSEGTITDVRSKSVTVAFQDTGTPSTTEFTTGLNGIATTSYDSVVTVPNPLLNQICVRVTDLDQNANPLVAETLTVTLSSSTGDTISPPVTLTETGVNTGIFVNCITREISSTSATEIYALPGDLLTVNYIDPTDPSDTSSASAVMSSPSPILSVSKQLVEPANGIATLGEQIRFNFTIANPNPLSMTAVTVTDTFPSACLSFSSASVTPNTTTATTLIWTDIGPLVSHSSRTISVYFTVVGACTPATNTVASRAVYSGSPLPATGTVADTADVNTTRPALTVAKTLTSTSPVQLGQDVIFHIVVTNSGTTQITTLPLTDNYSAYCMEFKSATLGGTGSGGTVSWANLGPLAAAASTSVDVTFTVRGPCNPAQNLAVIDNAVDTNGDPVPVVQSSATVVTQVTEPSMTKDFSPATVLLNGLSTLTFTITNPNLSGQMTGVGFSDTYPLGMENASPLTIVNATCGGTLDASAGGTSISYSGGTISASSSCTVSIDVKATASGSLNNVSGAVAAVIGGTGNTSSKTLTVNDPPVNTVPGVQTINPGVQTAVSGISVTDVNGNLSTTRVSVVSGTLNVSLVGGATISAGSNDTSTLTLSGTQTQINAALATLKFTGTVNDTLTVLSTDALALTDSDPVTIDVSLRQVDLSLAKAVNNASPKIGDAVIYTVTITNHSLTTAATTIVVHDALPAGLTLNSSTPSLGTFSASDWTISTLAANTSATMQLNVTVTQVGVITNTAEITASDQADPDLTNNQASVSLGGLFDPPLGIKTFNDAGLPELEFRLVWINSGNATAIEAQVTDNIPTGTTYVNGSLTCAPQGSSTNAAVATLPLNTIVADSFCAFDPVNNGVIQWQGSIGPDNGNLTEATAANEVVITFRVTVNDGVNQVLNFASSRTDTNGDRIFTDETVLGTSLVLSNQTTWNRNSKVDPGPEADFPKVLPTTGFAPNVVTSLPRQPVDKLYSATDVWIEIPNIRVDTSIVGVPLVNSDWDVSWLWQQAGWLNGTAFPGWLGNSVLTGHITLPNGKPGPFEGLGKLEWGDRIIVHAYGSVYTYEVRENRTITPYNTSVLKHEEEAWLTLLTCKTYNEKTESYSSRIAVRAVLLKVEREKQSVDSIDKR
jgi:LPXTG-site transpeptidase (sortase) family protein